MAIEIVDLPSYKMVIFHCYVSLPEGMFFFSATYLNQFAHPMAHLTWRTRSRRPADRKGVEILGCGDQSVHSSMLL